MPGKNLLPRIKYKKTPHDPTKPSPARPQEVTLTEQLDGVVQGQTASKDEERFSLALDYAERQGLIQGYEFQKTIKGRYNQPGENRLDFNVWDSHGYQWPIYIDGDWIHGQAAQKQKDMDQTREANDIFGKFGNAMKVRRVKSSLIQSIPEAISVVKQIFNGMYPPA
jgi:hypothetical protein